MLIRMIAALVLTIGLCDWAYAQARMQFELLGSGLETDDPTGLVDASTPQAPQALIRDLHGGTWWRGRVHPEDVSTAGSMEFPLVLAFKGAYSTTLTLSHPARAWQVVRHRYLHPGPSWSAQQELVVVLPNFLRDGEAFYLHVHDPRQRRIRPELQPLDKYLSEATGRRDVAIASATALLTLALLAVVFVGSFGDAAYRYLAVMACMSAGYVLGLNGEIFAILRIEGLAQYGALLQRSFAMLAVAFSHFFIIAFLRLRARRRLAAHLLKLFAWLQMTFMALSWLEGLDPSPWAAVASNLLILLSIPPVLWEAWRAHRQGIRAGRYVLGAWSPALLLLSLWVFALQDWLPRAAVDLGSWVSLGLALQVAVLLFGLADDSARLRRERDQATDEAEHDPLTGALNRRALQGRLHSLLGRAAQRARPLSLVYLDLDHFKRINDVHGHAAGDQCLLELVRRLDRLQRSGDLLARIGGEEFVLVLRDLDAAAATARADELRQRVANEPFTVERQRLAVTASLGVATWQPGESLEHWMQRADQALYRAKATGRNRVVADGSDPRDANAVASAGETT